MKEIFASELESKTSIAATVFVFPNRISELVGCLLDFTLVVTLIALLSIVWQEYIRLKGKKSISKRKKILFWEIATFSALFIFYLFGHYCVVPPLMFMLSILVLWYLVQVYAR